MTNETAGAHSASRVILASPRTLFRAFVDAEAMAAWRAPDGMTVSIRDFDPRVGGGYRMLLTRDDSSDAVGTNPEREELLVQFVELIAEEKVTERVSLASADPARISEMLLISSFSPVADGTRVTITAQGTPPILGREAQEAELAAILRKLARLTE